MTPSPGIPPTLEILRPVLARGLEDLRCEPRYDLIDGLLTYLGLLVRWNAVYNLSAIRQPDEMLVRHVFDSLSIAPYLGPGALADLGSGAGLPGIPLALLDRSRPVTLVESNGKKARFLRTAIRELALSRVDVVEDRAERAQGASRPWVTARALASLRELVVLADPWLDADGSLLAMKGPGVDAELPGLPDGFLVMAHHRLEVPGLDAERYLVVLKRAPATPHR